MTKVSEPTSANAMKPAIRAHKAAFRLTVFTPA